MSMLVLTLLSAGLHAAGEPEPLAPVPSAQQLAWQELEYGMFCHFGINTFHNEEWTDGSKSPATFLPTDFDARQWVEVARRAGMKYLVVTAKHHDGFALYPTTHSDYSVASSPWRDGRGDVLREVADACHEMGLMFGFYLSPWDRHEPKYDDPPAHDQHFKNMLREVITAYGPVGEVWFDGAGTKGHTYDWDGYYALVRELAPEALLAICGPDIRWVGNEDGVAPETLWNVQERNGERVWWPAECDVPIRKGQWFFHTGSEDKLRSLDELLDIYYRSVGHGAVLLLNVSPDRRGLLPEADVARLMELRAALDETFARNLAQDAAAHASDTRGGETRFGPANAVDGDPATYWAAGDGETEGWIEVDLGAPRTFDRLVAEEYVSLGQRVEEHRWLARIDDEWQELARGATVGRKRIHRIPTVTAQRVRLHIQNARACPAIRALGVYKASANEPAAR